VTILVNGAMSSSDTISDTTPPPVPGSGSGLLDELLDETFPRMLMLQTTSSCNSSCVFCPHRLHRKRLPQGQMDEALFRRLMVEASGFPQLACINLFLMNEPLTDPQLVERVHLAGALNPQAQISLWTNAVALDASMTRRLLASPLSSLGVSLHAHHPATYQRITGRRDFHRVLGNVVHFVEQRNATRPRMTVVLRFVSAGQTMGPDEQEQLLAFWRDGNVVLDIDEGHLSRAGNIAAPGEVREPHRWMAGCMALGGPKQAHILFTGQVVLCCMDYQRRTFLGDCTTESLHQIWSGPRRREHLETLYGVRPADPTFLCSRCELAIPARAARAVRGPDLPADSIWAAV
jgi:hypothetical protein